MKGNTLFNAGMFFAALFLLPGSLMAAHHEEAEAEPQQQAVAQLLTFCRLNEGKTMQEIVRAGAGLKQNQSRLSPHGWLMRRLAGSG